MKFLWFIADVLLRHENILQSYFQERMIVLPDQFWEPFLDFHLQFYLTWLLLLFPSSCASPSSLCWWARPFILLWIGGLTFKPWRALLLPWSPSSWAALLILCTSVWSSCSVLSYASFLYSTSSSFSSFQSSSHLSWSRFSILTNLEFIIYWPEFRNFEGLVNFWILILWNFFLFFTFFIIKSRQSAHQPCFDQSSANPAQ